MSDVITALTTEFSSIVTSLTSMVTSVAPIALPILGIGLAVTLGIRFFKRITNASA